MLDCLVSPSGSTFSILDPTLSRNLRGSAVAYSRATGYMAWRKTPKGKPVSKYLMQQELGYFRSVCRYAVKKRFLPFNPMEEIKLSKMAHRQATDSHQNYPLPLESARSPSPDLALIQSLCTMEPGCNLNIYRIEGDRPDFSFSKAMNAGLRAGNSPYVVFLNDDVLTVQPLWLSALVEKLETYNLPLVNPVQVDFQTSEDMVHQARILSDLDACPIRYASSQNKFGPKFVLGFCLLGRRADFLEVGGWDEGFSYHYEDLDFSLRMEHLRGGRAGIDQTTWVRHGGSVSTKRTNEDPEEGKILRGKVDASKAHFIRKWGRGVAVHLDISPPPGTFDFQVLTPVHPRIAGIFDLDCFAKTSE